jgi:hypothetical protein
MSTAGTVLTGIAGAAAGAGVTNLVADEAIDMAAKAASAANDKGDVAFKAAAEAAGKAASAAKEAADSAASSAREAASAATKKAASAADKVALATKKAALAAKKAAGKAASATMEATATAARKLADTMGNMMGLNMIRLRKDMLATAPMAVFWDVENMPIPKELSGLEVIDAIKKKLTPFGNLEAIRAFSDISAGCPPVEKRSDLQLSGCHLIDETARRLPTR